MASRRQVTEFDLPVPSPRAVPRLRVRLLIGRSVAIQGPKTWTGSLRRNSPVVVLRRTDTKAIKMLLKLQKGRPHKTGRKPSGTFVVYDDGGIARE